MSFWKKTIVIIATVVSMFADMQSASATDIFSELRDGGSTLFSSAQHYATNSGNTIAIARRYLGHGHFNGMPSEWCRSFVNKVLRQGGYYSTASDMAIDALRLGPHVRHPQPGDIMVMRGHVTFFAGYDGHGRLLGLGGNQGGYRGARHVQYSHYWPGRVIAFVRPTRGGLAASSSGRHRVSIYISLRHNHQHYAWRSHPHHNRYAYSRYSRHSHRYYAYYGHGHHHHYSHHTHRHFHSHRYARS